MPSKERGVSTLALIVIVAAIMAILVAAFIFLRYAAHSPNEPSGAAGGKIAEEERAYLPLLEFTDVRMSAAQNFLGDTLTYLDARVTNKGTKTVRRVDVELKFVDVLNQVVLLETAHPINTRTAALKPNETRPFRVTFEHMPADWNQAPPALTPVSVQF